MLTAYEARKAYQIARYATPSPRRLFQGAKTIRRAYMRLPSSSKRYIRNKAASTIQKGFRRMKSSMHGPSKIGEAYGTSNAKLSSTTNATTTVDTVTLYSTPLNDLQRGTGIDERQREHVQYKGVKIYFEYRNISNVGPIYMNCAVVGTKDTSSPSNVTATAFFRGSGFSRAQNFDGLTMSAVRMHLTPINTDNYVVLWHDRRTLAPNIPGSTPQTNMFDSYGTYDKWIPIRRQIRYQTDNTIPTDGRIFFCYWFSKFQNNGEAPDPTAQVHLRHLQYFSDPWH